MIYTIPIIINSVGYATDYKYNIELEANSLHEALDEAYSFGLIPYDYDEFDINDTILDKNELFELYYDEAEFLNDNGILEYLEEEFYKNWK